MKFNTLQNHWLKKSFLSLILILSFAAHNDAQGQELVKSLLWKLEGDSIRTSYVFGTFHMLPQADFEIKERVKKAFGESDQVVMELDMDDPNMQSELMLNIGMKDGNTLDQLMSKEDIKLLDDQLKSTANFSVAQVNTFKPFMVETFILPSFIEGIPASYEITFVQMAIDLQLPIEGLESVSDQANIFDIIPYEEQVEDLIDILKNRENMENLFARMIKLYKEEDINTLYNESLDYFNETEVDLLLHERNAKWIDTIAKFAQEKATFFAVGAGHLGGEKGVIRLLQEAGYRLTPVLE